MADRDTENTTRILAHDVDFLETETKFSVCICKGTESQCRAPLCAQSRPCHLQDQLPKQCLPHLSLHSETCKVEEVLITFGLEVYAII